MNAFSLLQYALFLGLVLVLVRPVGLYLHLVFAGERTILDPALRPLERAIYRLTGVDPHQEMAWKQYTTAFLLFSFAGTLLLYAILRIEAPVRHLRPAFRRDAVSPDLAMNTAVSFASTTTWQAYAGETTAQLSQPGRGAGGPELPGRGGRAGRRDRFHPRAGTRTNEIPRQLRVDLVRALLWILLPVRLVGSLVLV